MNRESDPAVESWLADVFAEARDELEPLPAEAVDAVIRRVDLRRHRRKWSSVRLGCVLGLAALVAGGATLASYHSWGRTTVSPQQLRQQAHITIGFLPLPGAKLSSQPAWLFASPTPCLRGPVWITVFRENSRIWPAASSSEPLCLKSLSELPQAIFKDVLLIGNPRHERI